MMYKGTDGGIAPRGGEPPLIPSPQHGLVETVLQCKAQRLAAPYRYSRETTQVAEATPT